MNWIRRHFAWSNSWEAWRERLFGLAFAFTAAGLFALGLTVMPLWLSGLAWSFFAILLAIASRQGWIKLFGPVLFYDMVRTARRSRYALVRFLYAAMLLFILLLMYLGLFLEMREHRVHLREIAMLAQTFFGIFMLVQLGMVLLLTPAYVAGAIADEKDKKTLEFLLATDLHNREIVLSKLLSRLSNMTLLLLTGLPILSILQFAGGVDPYLLLAGFAMIGLTLLGAGSVSILLSTQFQKPRDAISLTYLLLLTYIVTATVGYAMLSSRLPILSTPLWPSDSAPTLHDALIWFDAGNPLSVCLDVIMAVEGRTRFGARTTLADELAGILTRYTWFHLLVSAICVTWSIVRIRAIALKQSIGGTTKRLRWWQRLRPPMGNFPMLWKEVYIEGRTKLNWLIWLAVLVLFLLTVGSGLVVLGYALWFCFVDPPMGRFARLEWRHTGGIAMNVWFRIAGTFVGCLLLLTLGVRAATCITQERERDTFDALITTPLSAANMLTAKLVGNLTSMRFSWFWYTGMLALAVISGGVHPIAVPLLAAALGVYAVVMTMIGLGYSMVFKSSLQAATATVTTTILIGGGHWLLTTCCCAPAFGLVAANVRGPDRVVEKIAEYAMKFQAGVTPPFVLGFCPFTWEEVHGQHARREQTYLELIGFCGVGVVLWAGFACFLWFVVLLPTFRRLTRRVDVL